MNIIQVEKLWKIYKRYEFFIVLFFYNSGRFLSIYLCVRVWVVCVTVWWEFLLDSKYCKRDIFGLFYFV